MNEAAINEKMNTSCSTVRQLAQTWLTDLGICVCGCIYIYIYIYVGILLRAHEIIPFGVFLSVTELLEDKIPTSVLSSSIPDQLFDFSPTMAWRGQRLDSKIYCLCESKECTKTTG